MKGTLTSEQRVLTACSFRRPDRIPRFDSFWELPESWRGLVRPAAELSDISIWAGNETILPTRAGHVKAEGDWIYERDGWGRLVRRRAGAYFVETLEVAIPDGVDPMDVRFDSPGLESRYLMGRSSWAELHGALARDKRRHCVFAKTGGPFLRTTFVRGETQFLLDIAQDRPLARTIAERVGQHIMAVGVEEIKRWSLEGTGIWIYDDMAYNDAPLFSPKAFETIFLPTYRRMIRAYKDAGARYVFLHSDGNVMPLLDMLVDAGIDGLHPLERRAGMDPFLLRKRYPTLILAGGLCNTEVLRNGPPWKIRGATRRLIDLGRDGGVIVGTHSISPEVPVEHFLAYDRACREYGTFGD